MNVVGFMSSIITLPRRRMSLRSLSSSKARFLTRASPTLDGNSRRELRMQQGVSPILILPSLWRRRTVPAAKHARSDGKVLVEAARKASHNLYLVC